MKRIYVAPAVVCAVLAMAGAWMLLSHRAAPAELAQDAPLPVPPIPPRIAAGPDYDHCLALLGTDPDGAASYAASWHERGGGDGAAHCLALSRIAEGDLATGAAMLEALAAGSPAPDLARASLFDQAAQARLMLGDAAPAYADTTRAATLAPDNPDLLVDDGIAAGAVGQYRQAIDALSRALALDPSRVDALVARASDWRQTNRLDQARDDIDRALGLDPDDADALLERGIIRQRRDDLAGARTDWERAAALAPDTPTADLAQQNLALLDAGPDRQ